MHGSTDSGFPKSSGMAIKTPAQLRSKCQPRESCPRPKAPRIVSLQSQGFLPTPGVRQDPVLSCGVWGQPFFPQALSLGGSLP